MVIKSILGAMCTCLMVVSFSVIAETEALSLPSDFTSATVFTEDFEDPLDGQYLEFSASNSLFRDLASRTSSGVTTSGLWVLVGAHNVIVIKPLVETYEIGLYFGNDRSDYDVFLNAYDDTGASVGKTVILPTVRRTVNGNSVVDQFIGIRTDVPIARAVLEYGTTSDSMVIDDVSIGLGSPISVVSIDIKPSNETNTINIGSAGVIPVAILGAVDFDATTVEPTSVSLAGASVKMVGKSDKYLCHQDDVNNDGFIDLVCQIYTAQFFVEEGETTAILEAETLDGTKLRGEDIIRIVPDN